MDDRRFDAFARSLASGASRRRVLKGLLGSLVGGLALGGASRTYAEDEDPPVTDPPVTDPPATDPPVTDPPATDPPATDPPTTDPPATDPPATDPPTTDPPATDPPATDPPATDPPATDPPATDPPADLPAADDPSVKPALDCDYARGQIACDTVCCDPEWRCCGVYCVPPGSCCGDAECEPCQACNQDGYCYDVCDDLGLACCVDENDGSFICAECCRNDPKCEVVVDCEFCAEQNLECCVDSKHNVSCAQCCDNSDCLDWSPCATCYGGYCLTCFDQTDGKAPICAPYECELTAAGGNDAHCVECCADYQCGACERCHNGWCEYVCDADESCCTVVDLAAAELVNGGYCAHCCGNEDCGDCERCDAGHCRYECDRGEICCHGEWCASEREGCCGVQGNWCELLAPADHLNGSCCDGLRCCYDKKTHGGSCAECCDDRDCGDGVCCGGICQNECCSDHDCRWGTCVDGNCVECGGNDDCGKGEICCEGRCTDEIECCYGNADDPVNCGECETCIEGWCRPTGVELYGACNPMMVIAGWDVSTPQLNCCNGLVCCDTQKHGLVCLECCADADCADGCYCDDGFCSCPCWGDSDCADGTCCCKNGSCSADCCYTPPPKPHDHGGKVTTLPATGHASSQEESGWLGAAALGAAAALLAARKLKAEETTESQLPEE